jgi:deoxyguanosine kinase
VRVYFFFIFFYFGQKTKRMHTIVISGNIGSGKSSVLRALQSRYADSAVFIEEPVHEWGPLLKKMYDSRFNSESLFLFQSLVFAHYMRVTSRLVELEASGSTKIVFVERSPRDALNVFLPINKDSFEEADYLSLIYIHKRLLSLDVWSKNTACILLRVPPDVCKTRIDSRCRDGETETSNGGGVGIDYLRRIDQFQNTICSAKNTHEIDASANIEKVCDSVKSIVDGIYAGIINKK